MLRLSKELLNVSIGGDPLAEFGSLNGGDRTIGGGGSNSGNDSLLLLGGKRLGNDVQGEIKSDDSDGQLEKNSST